MQANQRVCAFRRHRPPASMASRSLRIRVPLTKPFKRAIGLETTGDLANVGDGSVGPAQWPLGEARQGLHQASTFRIQYRY